MSTQNLIEQLGYDLVKKIVDGTPDDSAQYVFFYAANPQNFKFGKIISAKRYIWLDQCKRWGEQTLRSSYSEEYDDYLSLVQINDLRAAIDKREAECAVVKDSNHWDLVMTLGCLD